jgi:nucleotide-binding universal stress UspA family protein
MTRRAPARHERARKAEMMPKTEPSVVPEKDVVVGVDGSAASLDALRWARGEAHRLGTGVDVVRVEHGHVVESLVAAGDQGSVLVVGSDRRQLPLRLMTGNVSTGVAARCSVPVVSVPETWRPGRAAGIVLVGVKHPHHSQGLVAEAYAVALRRGSRLVLLHAPRFPYRYDVDRASGRTALREWEQRARHEMEELLAPWRQQLPEVDVEVRVVHDQAAHALVTAAAEADEVVIVRRSLDVPTAAHLGLTARTVLLHAPCPVRVVPDAHVPVLHGRRLELAGAAT